MILGADFLRNVKAVEGTFTQENTKANTALSLLNRDANDICNIPFETAATHEQFRLNLSTADLCRQRKKGILPVAD